MEPKSTEFTEKKLQECLSSIYDSSRIATEINSLESKLDSLNSIKETLISGENISATNLDQMNRTIGDLQANIDKKRESILVSEKQVIQAFFEVITHISNASSKKAIETTTHWNLILTKFGDTLRTDFKKTLSITETALKEIRDSKMDISEKENIKEQLETFKSNMMQTFKKNLQQLTQTNNDALNYLSDRLSAMIKENDPSKVAIDVENKLDEKIQEQLNFIKRENEKAIASTNEKFDSLSTAVVTSVRNLIQQTISPANIQSLITSLPEYELLKKGAENVNQNSSNDPLVQVQPSPNLEAIKQSITKLASELVELKQTNQQTKTIVDTIRSQSLPQNINTQDLDYKVALKRMEEMEKEVSIIYNNIKMIETTISLKNCQKEDDQLGNKRARLDLDGNSITRDQYLSSLQDVQLKHQSLIDYIVQWKDTVLDESFHKRLEAVIAKIEQVLLNHERFIHFLVDPFAASKKETASIPTEPVPEGTLSPAMIDAISLLVKKTAEEVSLPLEKKIKLLEQKLQAKSS